MNNQAKPVDGARSVYRALQLLDLVAHHHEDGIGLAELVTLTGLDRTTVYRLASTLERENLLERDTDSRRYHLGMESMQIGLTTMSRAPILDDCVPAMKAIAQESEDIVFLVVRNGDYAHCLHLEEAPSHPDSHPACRGLRLLGLGTAGQALLATLPDKEINAIQHRHRVEYEARGLPSEQHGNRGAGAPPRPRQDRRHHHAGRMRAGRGLPHGYGGHAAISVAAISERMPPARQAMLLQLIHEQLLKRGFAPVATDAGARAA